MFKRLIDNASLWFSLGKIERQATLSFIEEAKEVTKEPEIKEMSWFTTKNNIIDEFYDFTVVNYGDSEIKEGKGPDEEEADIPSTFQKDFEKVTKEIEQLREKWGEDKGVVTLDTFISLYKPHDQEKKEVLDSVREGEDSQTAI